MDRIVSNQLTTVNSAKRTNFEIRLSAMAVRTQPEIDGEHFAFAERFRRACEWAGWLVFDKNTRVKKAGSFREVAEGLAISRAYAYDMYLGRQFPSGSKGADIANSFGVSASWLLANQGPMVTNCLVDLERLSDRDREIVMQIIESMEQKGEQSAGEEPPAHD